MWARGGCKPLRDDSHWLQPDFCNRAEALLGFHYQLYPIVPLTLPAIHVRVRAGASLAAPTDLAGAALLDFYK